MYLHLSTHEEKDLKYTMSTVNDDVYEENNDSSSVRATKPKLIPLPPDFEPAENDVICAKGKRAASHAGNEKFIAIVKTKIADYLEAPSKSSKTSVLASIVALVYQATPRPGEFVKQKQGRWYKLSNRAAREKAGQVMRDILHTKYRSSNKVKNDKRSGRCERVSRRKRKKSGPKTDQSELSSSDPGSLHFASVARMGESIQDCIPSIDLSATGVATSAIYAMNVKGHGQGQLAGDSKSDSNVSSADKVASLDNLWNAIMPAMAETNERAALSAFAEAGTSSSSSSDSSDDVSLFSFSSEDSEDMLLSSEDMHWLRSSFASDLLPSAPAGPLMCMSDMEEEEDRGSDSCAV